MRALLYVVPAISFLLLGAHFLRDGSLVATTACAILALLLAWPKPWITRLLQAALVLGTLEWIWTAHVLVQERMAAGRPWGRMALILGIVALVTAASVAALQVRIDKANRR